MSGPNSSSDNADIFPSRIDMSLPETFNRLLPIPLARVYSTHDKRLTSECFDILDYTVQLLLDMATHLSPTERERLGDMGCIFYHPESGLLIHTSKSFANFAFECILKEHNSTEPLVLCPSWPSVYFDENGYPSFCDANQQQERMIEGPADDGLAGENIPLGDGNDGPVIIPDNPHPYRHQQHEQSFTRL